MVGDAVVAAHPDACISVESVAPELHAHRPASPVSLRFHVSTRIHINERVCDVAFEEYRVACCDCSAVHRASPHHELLGVDEVILCPSHPVGVHFETSLAPVDCGVVCVHVAVQGEVGTGVIPQAYLCILDYCLTVLRRQVEEVVFKIEVVDRAVLQGNVVVEVCIVDYRIPDESERHVASDTRNYPVLQVECWNVVRSLMQDEHVCICKMV